MDHITLTEEQISILTVAKGPLEVRNPDGSVLGFLQPSLDALMVAKVQARGPSKDRKIPSSTVRDFLQTMDQAAARGASEAELRELSRQLLAEAEK